MQEEFDTNKYRPYKDYRGLCKFKSLKERNISWPTFEKVILDDKYILRPMRESEIGDVVDIYRTGFPDLYGNTNNEIVLWPDTLRKYLQSEDGFMKGDRLLIVGEKIDEKKLIGAVIVKIDKGNMSIHWEHGVVHPDYRGKKIFREMCIYCDQLSEKTGAEYGSIMAATFHPITQKVFQELGWNIRGIAPGAILLWNYGDKYYRHSVIYFDKFFNNGEELVPKEMDLTPEVESVSECVMTATDEI